MTTTVLRKGPTGKLIAIPDTSAVPPGTLLGRSLTDVGSGLARPLTGLESGAIVRAVGYYAISLPAGQYDDLPIPDGTRVVDITPTGAVVISSFLMSGRGNAGAYLIVRKRGASGAGTLSFNNNVGGTSGNRFFTPSASPYTLSYDNDAVALQHASDTVGTRFVMSERALLFSGLEPALAAEMGIPFYVRGVFTATGAAGDDVPITTLALPRPVVVYDSLLVVGTLVAASTATVRTATGGLGTAVSNAMSTATTGVRRNDLTSSPALPAGTNLFLNRSTGNTAGQVFVFMKATG
jgi:hypothetical protein